MKAVKLITFLLLVSYITSSAQVMNVRKWRKTERDSLDAGMVLYEENSYLQALPVFESILSHHPDEEFLKFTYAKCALYRSDKHEDAYKYFSEVYDRNKKLPDIQYDMALACHYTYKFDEADKYITLYTSKRHTPEAKTNADALKRNIYYAKQYYAKPTAAKISNLGSNINSADDEYVPAILADESALIYTYSGVKSIGGRQNAYLQKDPAGSYMEDIYMSYRENDEFKPSFSLDSLNTNAPDAAISLSNDGKILFIYQDIGDSHGDIYESELVGDHYTKAKKLKGEINSYSWDGHCSLSPDGQTLFFSSERSGGYGGRDIYRASMSADSTWGHIVNLGDSVNTAYDDDAPFISGDGVTLFFSSKGRTSMGGYDIFRAIMNAKDSTFKRSENLGYPINSPSDDIYFVLAANGNNAYYSSGKKDGMGMKDIYKVETNFTGEKPSLYLVKGKVKDGTSGAEANIKVEISSKNNKLYKTLTSNSSTGAYLVTLPAGANYHLTYTYKDRPEQHLNIDAVDLAGYAEKIRDVNFEIPTPLPLVLTDKKAIAIRNGDPNALAEVPKSNLTASAAKPDKETTDKKPTEQAEAKKPIDEAAAKAKEEALAKADTESRAKADEVARKQLELAEAKKAKADEAARIKEEAVAKAKADAQARAEALAKKQADAAEARKTAAEAAALAKEEAATKAKADAQARAEALAQKQAELAEAKKLKAEEAARVKEETAAKAKADAQARAEALAKKQAEQVEAKKAAKEAAALAAANSNTLRAQNQGTGAAWDFTTNPVTSTPLNLPKTKKESTIATNEPVKEFVPVNGPQIKAIKFTEKYSDVTANDMEFRVQVAAVKNDKNVVLPNQKKLGKIEKLTLGDGFTRITVGGSFKTLGEALAHNKKVVQAGQKEGFIIALYKGKRVSYEELEQMGLLK